MTDTDSDGLRVVSLLPSATELVAAVGAAKNLVGVSHECDFPAGVVGLPIVTHAKCVTGSASSGEIDRSVRSLVERALSVYDIDVEMLEALKPDVVITQDLCEVCAVSMDDVTRAVARLTRPDIRIVNLSPLRLNDIFDDLIRVGDALAEREAATRARSDLEARVAVVRRRAASVTDRPKVLSVEWIDPVMIGGTWMPELIELAGGTPLVTEPGDHAPTLSFDQLAALEPDRVIIKPCGFSIERSVQELPELERLLPWKTWRCVAEGQVLLADGNQYFNRPGPRIVDSLEIMAACVHPEAFSDFVERYSSAVFRVTPDLVTAPL